MGTTKRKHDAIDAPPTGIERYFTRPAKKAGTDSAKLQNRHGLRPHNRRSLLLDLPGELRNRIYDLIVEDLENCESDHEEEDVRNKRCPDCPVLIHKPTIKHDRGCFLPTVAYRSYFGLTQTCRTIRSEFRCSYLSNAQVVIPLDMLKRYTKTFIEGVKYLHGNRCTTVRVTGPTRRLGHGGIDILPFLSEACCDACIFLDRASVLIADNALLDALNKLFGKWGVFDDLVYDGHITQIRMREIPTKYSWEEHEFDDCWREETTPLIVISFKLSKEYGSQWSPTCGRDMPEELVELFDLLEPTFPKMIEYQCDLWEEYD